MIILHIGALYGIIARTNAHEMKEFLIQNKEWLFSGLAIAILMAIYKIVRSVWSRIRSRPTLEDVEVSLAIHHPNTRTCSGSFIAVNPTSKPCDITAIELASNNVFLPDVNLVSLKGRPRRGRIDATVQKLPIAIPEGRHRVFFLTKEVPKVHRGELPDTVVILVSFKKSMLKSRTLNQTNDHHYT